jgi:hypothetical protein
MSYKISIIVRVKITNFKKVLSIVFAFFTGSISIGQITSDHVKEQYILMLDKGFSVNQLLNETADLNGTPTNLRLVKTLSKSMNIFLVESSQSNEKNLLDKIKSTSGVLIAQYNHYVRERVNVPDDTYFSSMWSLDNTGQSGGTVDADIDAPEAWNIATGGLTATGDTIVVAVIDGGFQLTHADISFWKNYNEIAANGIDDDGNGYIDDVNGWNAINSNGSIGLASHGTHVAGTIGAKGNNAMGTVGVNWNVKIMAVQGSTTNEAEAVEAYSYVRDNRKLYDQTNGAKGAFVVATNSSFGVDQGKPSDYPLWCAMYDSLGEVGILSAGATANQNWNIDLVGDIPTGCSSPYLISVTNTTRLDQKYSSAGFGATAIDIGAPGTTIYSTVPTNSWSQSSWTGTSMATPHVAGTVGLMFAAACEQLILDYKADPAGVALIMSNYLVSGADVLSSMNGMCVTSGRLNANNALLNVQSYSACLTSAGKEKNNELILRNVFPNPGNSWFETEYVSDADNFNVVIGTVEGKILKTIQRTNHKGINKHKIDLEDLAPGIYMIFVETPSSRSNIMRVVKM